MLADAFDDELTRELPSALRTFTDLDPFVVAPPTVTSIRPPAAAIPELALAIAAIVLVWSCAFAGAVGVAIGRTSEAGDHGALVTARVPRVAVVTAAHEAITEPPATAPEKLVVVDAPVTRPAATPGPRPAPRRPGFQRPSSLPRR